MRGGKLTVVGEGHNAKKKTEIRCGRLTAVARGAQRGEELFLVLL